MDNYKLNKYLKYKNKYLDMKGGSSSVTYETNCLGEVRRMGIINCLKLLARKQFKTGITSPILLFSIRSTNTGKSKTNGFVKIDEDEDKDIIYYTVKETEDKSKDYLKTIYEDVSFEIFNIDAITVYITKELQYYNILDTNENIISYDQMCIEINIKIHSYFEQIVLYISEYISPSILEYLCELLICNHSYYIIDISKVYRYSLIGNKNLLTDCDQRWNHFDFSYNYHGKIIEGLINKIKAICTTLIYYMKPKFNKRTSNACLTILTTFNYNFYIEKVMNSHAYTQAFYPLYINDINEKKKRYIPK